MPPPSLRDRRNLPLDDQLRLRHRLHLLGRHARRELDEPQAIVGDVEDAVVGDDPVDAGRAGERQLAALEDLLLPLLRDVLHRHDEALGRGHEIHRPAHPLHHRPRHHPIGNVALGRDLHGPENRDVDLAAADHSEGVGAGEIRRARNDRHGLLAGVDEVGVDVFVARERPQSEDAVLRLQDDFDPLGDAVGHERRHADAEVDVIAVAQLLRGAADDLFAVQWHRYFLTVRCSMRLARLATTRRWTKMPGVWMQSGSSSPSSTSSSTSAMQIFPAVAAIGLKLRAVLRKTRLPWRSAFCAATREKSPTMRRSMTYWRPPNSRVSFPSATTVPNPAGV